MSLPLRRVAVTDGDLGRHHFSLLRGAEGIRVHQRVQKNRGASYQAEISITTDWVAGGLQLVGRIDGLISTPEGPVVEEIKTCRFEQGAPESDRGMHRLQARLYAWMWWKNFGVCPEIHLRWVHPDPDIELPQEHWSESPETLDADIVFVLERFSAWQRVREEWKRQRNRSLQPLPFPYPSLRPGQETLMDAVANVMQQGGRLDAQAPTGLGKTLAVLVPALRGLGQGNCSQLMVCTQRNSGKTVMEDAFRLLSDQGAKVHALTLVVRERICRETGSPCDCSQCPLAIGFYDRVETAMQALRQEGLWDRNTWQRVAAEHRLCPFAFMMIAAREADVWIGDVNYALDPSARLEFVFREDAGKTVLLLDEAHHLPDRARSMLSAELDLRGLRDALHHMPPPERELLAPCLRKVQREIRAWQRGNLDREGLPLPAAESPERIAWACGSCCEQLEHSLAVSPSLDGDGRPQLLRDLRAFQLSVERRQASHITYSEDSVLVHFCRDVSDWLREQWTALHAVVLFSATLDPMDPFARLTGGCQKDVQLTLSSPFEASHLQVTLETSIPMVWRARTSELYDRLVSRIQSFLAEQPGKSLVFVPSYAVLNEVARRMPHQDLLSGPLQVQPKGLQEDGVEAFLAPFRNQPGPVTGLAVLGGPLNEGIDLAGDALTTVVVVSIGLPALCRERELLREWFQSQGEEGFLLAYSLPGLNRVRQAVGRILRGPEDRGRVLLVDSRFDHPLYRTYF